MTLYSMSKPPRPKADPVLTQRPTTGQWPLANTPRGARRRVSVRSGVCPRRTPRRRSLPWWSRSGACPPPCPWSSASSSAPSPPWSSSSSSYSRFGQEWMYLKWSRFVITSEWRLHQLLMRKNFLFIITLIKQREKNTGFCVLSQSYIHTSSYVPFLSFFLSPPWWVHTSIL